MLEDAESGMVRVEQHASRFAWCTWCPGQNISGQNISGQNVLCTVLANSFHITVCYGRRVLFGILVIQSLAHPVASVTPDWASKGCPDAIRCPEPDKGTKLSTCMIHMVEVVGTSNCSVDLPGNFTLVPNATVLREISQLAEVMACQMSDAQVDLYCQAAYDPLLEQAIKGRLHIRKGHPTGQHIRAHPSEFKDPFQTDGVNLNPNPFQKDGQSGLFLPHEAEYALTAESNSYNLIMGSLRILPGPVIDDPSGRSRTNLEPVAAATVVSP